MTASTILTVILVFLVLDYFWEQWLDLLNLRAFRDQLPTEVSDVYDEEKYKRSQQYHREKTRFSFVTSTFSLILAIVVFSTGLLGWLDLMLRGMIDSNILRALCFFGILGLAGDIVSLPFQYYSTFVLEEKYGFNRTTLKTFITDKLKGYLLAALLGGAILGLLIYLLQVWGSDFWWIFWIAITAFMLVMNFFSTFLIQLFNKLTPLPEGELRTAITEYCQKVKFPLTKVYVMDGSKRSSKSNAFFSGLGRKKKVVLYDTLIENHSPEELVAVIAHEVGHYKRKHIIQGLIIGVLQTGLMLYLMSWLVFNQNLSLALGAESLSLPINLLAFALLYSPVSKILGILGQIISRKNEFEADAFATETYRGNSLIKALKKLSSDNLSNLQPHPWYVFFHYSHPPLLERIKAIRNRTQGVV